MKYNNAATYGVVYTRTGTAERARRSLEQTLHLQLGQVLWLLLRYFNLMKFFLFYFQGVFQHLGRPSASRRVLAVAEHPQLVLAQEVLRVLARGRQPLAAR